MSAPQPVDPGCNATSEIAATLAMEAGRPEIWTRQQGSIQPRATKSLPIEVVINIFQRIDPRQVQTAALVCSSWRTAAVAATHSISVQFTAASRVKLNLTNKATSLRQWLSRHGAGLREMSIAGRKPGQLELPLDQLQQLQALSAIRLQLVQWNDPACSADTATIAADETSTKAANSVDADVVKYLNMIDKNMAALQGLSMLTSLTRLSLDQCPAIGSFDMLSTLTGLQELYLARAPAAPWKGLSASEPAIISPATIKQLTQLTSLTIDPNTFRNGTAAGFRDLTNLQDLAYINNAVKDAKLLAELPSRLTCLKAAWGGKQLLTRSLAPGLAKLASLQHLKLSAVVIPGQSFTLHSVCRGIRPCVIRGLTQLTHLVLSGLCRDALLSLLSVMGGLRELRHLDLSNNDAVHDHQIDYLDLNQYSSLTASSHLTYLGLWNSYDMFSEGVGEYVFPPGMQLPGLKVLKIGQNPSHNGEFDYTIIDQQTLDRVIQQCPAIEQLSLTSALDEGVDELVTTQLTGLTQLAISGWGFEDDTIEALLPRLTQLRNLTLRDMGMTDVGLWELTRLTGLTRLDLCGEETSEALTRHGLTFECTEGSPTPVWQQLQSACRLSAQCLGVMLNQAKEALTGSHQREQALTQQLSSTQQQLAAVQQQLQQAMRTGILTERNSSSSSAGLGKMQGFEAGLGLAPTRALAAATQGRSSFNSLGSSSSEQNQLPG